MSSLIVDGLPPQAKKKTVSISFFGPLDEGMMMTLVMTELIYLCML